VKIECEYRATIGSFRVRIFCAQVWNLPSTRIHMRVVKGAFSKLSRRLLSHLHGIAFPRKSFAFLCNLRLFRYFVHRSLLSLAVHASVSTTCRCSNRISRQDARTSARCSTFLIDAFDILPVFRVSRLTNICVTRVLSTCLSYLSDFEVSVVPACEFQGNKTMPQEMNVLCCYACKMYQVS